MQKRILTALMIIACVMPPLYLGGPLLNILMIVIGILGMYEVLKIRNSKLDIGLYIISLCYISLVSVIDVHYFSSITLLFLMTVCLIAIISPNYQFDDISLIFIVAYIIGASANTIIQIYDISGYIMIFIVVSTYLTDTAAYFCGYFFGKHKLNERVSPKKTIEGAIGGWLISCIVSLILGNFIVTEYITMPIIIVLSIFIPIIAQIGDLTFSLIKRHYDVKDFGSIFPGHGGILDRLDSLFFTLMFYSIVMVIVG